MWVYIINNDVNAKIYIGKTVNLINRWTDHIRPGSDNCMPIHKAIKKYGYDQFHMIPIQYCQSEEEMNEMEKYWIAELRRQGIALYNIADGGNGIGRENHPFRGKHLSDDTKKKLSVSHKGKKFSIESRQKMAQSKQGKPGPNKDKKFTEKAKQNMSEAHKGKTLSIETRNKISKNSAKIWLGKSLTEEHKNKISQSLKGKFNNLFGKEKVFKIKQLFLEGYTKVKIAQILNISLTTVRKYLK